MIIFMQKIKDIEWFFSAKLLIKECCNLIEQATQMVTANQKSQF